MAFKPYGGAFVKRHKRELQRFLKEALKHGYGMGIEPMEEPDGEQRYEYQQGFWGYEDVYYGGEPYGGMTTVSYQGTVCWVMTYYGRVLKGADKELVYQTLHEALRNINPEMPVRGKRGLIAETGLKYLNGWNGDLKFFQGRESIVDENGRELYVMNYSGGFVNLR